MEDLLNKFEELLQDINQKATEIMKEAERLNNELKNDYPNEEQDREREKLGI